MDLTLVGLSHKTAPIELREKFAFSDDRLDPALRSLRDDFGFSEAMIVSTCNRVEILTSQAGSSKGAGRISEFLCRFHSVDSGELDGHLYTFERDELVRHVFRVASSLDSMVPGEAQILGQLKQAYSQAHQIGVVGRSLCRLLPHAFFVAKRVRTETNIASSAVSVSSVAVELAKKIFDELEGQTVLLLGAGKMSELAAQSLLQAGASNFKVTNRTISRAAEVASKFNGTVTRFESLEDSLVESDIAIVSTGASNYILPVDLVERVIRRRRYSPLFIIDISVPRNVHPDVNEIENVFLYDIDDLQSVISANLQEREKEAESAYEIVEQEVQNFVRIIERRNIGPYVSGVRRRVEELCLEELARARNGMEQSEYEKLERLMKRAAHRIAHPLMIQLKKDDPDPNRQYYNLKLIREAFDLEEEE